MGYFDSGMFENEPDLVYQMSFSLEVQGVPGNAWKEWPVESVLTGVPSTSAICLDLLSTAEGRL